MRYLLFIIFLLTISCSIDTESGIWNQKINKMKLSQININDLNKKLQFDEYKKIYDQEFKKNGYFKIIKRSPLYICKKN